MTRCAFCGGARLGTWRRDPGSCLHCRDCETVIRDSAGAATPADYHSAIAAESEWDAETPASVLAAYARFVATRFRARGPVVDFGTGTGGFVSALRSFGVAARGVEPSPTARDAACASGLPVVPALGDLPKASWGGATAIEVAEHIPEPRWLRELYALLSPGAFLFVTTPNRDSVAAHIGGPRWSQLTNPFHITFFNARALRRTMEGAGFRNVRLVRTGPVLGRTPVHRLGHAALLALGRHSSLRMVGYKPAQDPPCG